jgi:hypothetical protein
MVNDEEDSNNLYPWLDGLDTWLSRKSQGFNPGYDVDFFVEVFHSTHS